MEIELHQGERTRIAKNPINENDAGNFVDVHHLYYGHTNFTFHHYRAYIVIRKLPHAIEVSTFASKTHFRDFMKYGGPESNWMKAVIWQGNHDSSYFPPQPQEENHDDE